jgi:hypothetical protein
LAALAACHLSAHCFIAESSARAADPMPMSATAPASMSAERSDMDGSPKGRPPQDAAPVCVAKLPNFFASVNATPQQKTVKTQRKPGVF